MRISIHPELERVWNLFNEGKLEEALQLLIEFEKLGDLNPEDKHYDRFLKSLLFFRMARFQESLKIAEQDYQESKNQQKHLFLIDSILSKFFTLFFLKDRGSPSVKNSEIRKDVEESTKLLKSVTQDPSNEVELREGFLFLMRGFMFYWENKLDQAIKLFKKSLAISEKYDTFGFDLNRSNLYVLGVSYAQKGELDLALDYLKESLDLYKGSTPIINNVKGVSYNNIGNIYFQKRNPDQAIRYFEKSLKIMEQNTDPPSISWSGRSYDCMITVFLHKKSLEGAQECLDKFNQFLEKKRILIWNIWQKKPEDFLWYRLSKARIFASSSRARDIAKAEEILKNFLDEDSGAGIHINSLMVLCELYFKELETSSDLKILDDIQPLVGRLIKESERMNSYSLRAHAFLLNGWISLLRLNMGDARRYLMEAQDIAESNGLQLLARGISHAHDQLIEQLEGLESYKKNKMTLSERLELASLDETLDLMQGRRALNAPTLTDEEPVLLLIIGEGGILLFSYPFSEEVKVEDELFGGFLSAITSFSDEVFSQGLDRAKFGHYTVLMKDIGDFSFCYVLKGQTYVAQKRLSNFVESFQKNTSMMQTLNKFNQTSQVIELKDFPFLEGFIEGFFTNR
ncbi:MAG: tetratricopeptide repeat protein [Promethearchaeota archaeon]